MRAAGSTIGRRVAGWRLAAVCAAAGVVTLVSSGAQAVAGAAVDAPIAEAGKAAKKTLQARHGAAEAARIDRGVDQVIRLWRPADGEAAELREFLETEFIPRGAALDATFARLESAFERLDGYMNSLSRDWRQGVDLDLGPLLPIDRRLAEFEPSAHVTEDLFRNRIGFVALLNFPLTTLSQRLEQGGGWSRREWAETRLAHRFSTRLPAEVVQAITAAFAQAETYINDYNIYMHHLVTARGDRPFPAGLRLITHWGLRDELKARYADADGLERQRLIQKVMERIVLQEIPAAVVNNPRLDWDPLANSVRVSTVQDVEPPPGTPAEASTTREPDTRYATLLGIFRAVRKADPFDPDNPTFIDRRFNVDREIPEDGMRALLTAILEAPVGAQVAKRIAARLGRPLEPFDIWYAGFKPRQKHAEADLDARTRQRYPTAAAYAADMPRLFLDLGFDEAKARFLAEHIVVDPSRGAGHALGAARRDDQAHLRTRVEAGGMNYKGYNIAVHEMGHNVEQVFSMTTIDHTLLQGVPNNAFTEALAFVFQARDLELLGLKTDGGEAASLRALDTFWTAREIAGVALVDIGAWRWMYGHPDATPAAFREAVVALAREVWNRHYAAIFGVRDVPILAVYSHMISNGLYLPDYPIGHLIAFQVEEHFRKLGSLGPEFERVSRIGALTPDAWMRQAVGGPLSARPMLEAVAGALAAIEGRAAGIRPEPPAGS
jgi:hypothetical protein